MSESGIPTMRLSAAIRLGAMMKPQHYGNGYGPENKASCAFFAAIDAVGGFSSVVKAGDLVRGSARGPALIATEDQPSFTIPNEWELVTNEDYSCPDCHCITLGILIISEHLNDQHRWTREQIATWVEAIENAQPEITAPKEHEHANT